MLNLNHFNYTLPQELIAQQPLKKREAARLMVVDRAQKTISHDVFSNIGKYLPPESVMVFNNSRVVPVRLLGNREQTGGAVEIFLLKRLSDGYSYQALLRPLKRLRKYEQVVFKGSTLVAQVMDIERRIVKFNKKNIIPELEKIGHIPLPPYIKRPDTRADRTYYQTVFARHNGSVASPTAGLHFSEPLLEKLKKDGHALKQVTLHINYATFKPVEEENIEDHQMHTEYYSIGSGVNHAIMSAKKKGKKIVAVGTTSCRVLESVEVTGKLRGDTNLFIYPGYEFKMVDALITNFHLPLSTLLMLVYAFGSTDMMKKAYAEAVKKKYRFYSYGDGMIIK